MEKCGAIQYEKWAVYPLSVCSKAVTRIDFKLPANVKQCTGVAFTISDIQGCFNPTDIGEICLLFNNRKSHPLNFQVDCKTSRFRMDELILKLEEPVVGSSRIEGYYKNNLSITYSLIIYLQCIAIT